MYLHNIYLYLEITNMYLLNVCSKMYYYYLIFPPLFDINLVYYSYEIFIINEN